MAHGEVTERPPEAGAPWAQLNATLLNNMYYVYIIYSRKLKKLYTGVTQNLKLRLRQHNNGNTTYTSLGVPWKLIYYEVFLEKEDAYREEKFLKTGKGRDRRKFLLKTWLEKNKI